ncbi:hypothetical protein [Chryseobacterium fluminis]|uniref:hypothetical protein n=1 Tax=Chryseobacterium fluminis TaxID=2983606 RepID=UPI002B1CC73A|nr:hypothetical protein [Chryseobacterium sp. MMS21-Ot14]
MEKSVNTPKIKCRFQTNDAVMKSVYLALKEASGADERYLRDFIYFTQRGLYSFDKTHLNNFTDNLYHLVTTPVKPLEVTDLSPDILDILTQTKIEDNIKLISDLDVRKII